MKSKIIATKVKDSSIFTKKDSHMVVTLELYNHLDLKRVIALLEESNCKNDIYDKLVFAEQCIVQF